MFKILCSVENLGSGAVSGLKICYTYNELVFRLV